MRGRSRGCPACAAGRGEPASHGCARVRTIPLTNSSFDWPDGKDRVNCIMIVIKAELGLGESYVSSSDVPRKELAAHPKHSCQKSTTAVSSHRPAQ